MNADDAAQSAQHNRHLDVPKPGVSDTPAFDTSPDDGQAATMMTGPCAILGGGKRDKPYEEDQILEDDDIQYGERTTPGHLRDRLVVLQERAFEAIRALPVQCDEDYEFGQVETRNWGLEALKHVLRMRLALQSNLMLTRPVEGDVQIPPAVELLAANLTL